MYAQTDDNTVIVDCNPSADIALATPLILKLTLLIDLPFYLIF
jgi:hypothetical protein